MDTYEKSLSGINKSLSDLRAKLIEMKFKKNSDKALVNEIISQEKSLVAISKKLDKERPGLITTMDSY